MKAGTDAAGLPVAYTIAEFFSLFFGTGQTFRL
jgi:hypothetical protein